MVRQFKEAIARRPDGISLMGHPGEPALGRLIEEARAKGIIVTTANAFEPLIIARTAWPTASFFLGEFIPATCHKIAYSGAKM